MVILVETCMSVLACDLLFDIPSFVYSFFRTAAKKVFSAIFYDEASCLKMYGSVGMTRRKNQHVVKHPKGWAVKGAGNSKATKVTRTQREAIQVAERIARNKKTDTKIHGRNGKIRAGNSYGNDPYPPRDRK